MDRTRWLVNPKQHRPRLTIKGRKAILGRSSPYKGKITKINPYLMEYAMGNPKHGRKGHGCHSGCRHGYRGNPGGLGGIGGAVTHVVKHPIPYLKDGTLGVLAAYFTLSIPNALLPASWQGTDLMSKVVRLLARVATGAGIVAVGHKMAGSGSALAAGASMAAAGGFVLDFLNTRLVIGTGDVGQKPGDLFASISLPSLAGLGAYQRSNLSRQLGAYTRSGLPGQLGDLGRRRLVAHNLFGGD